MGIQEVLKEIENDPDTIKTFQVNPKQKIGSLSVKEFTQLMDVLIEKKVSQLLIDHEVKRMSFESFSHEEVAGDTNSYLTSRRIEKGIVAEAKGREDKNPFDEKEDEISNLRQKLDISYKYELDELKDTIRYKNNTYTVSIPDNFKLYKHILRQKMKKLLNKVNNNVINGIVIIERRKIKNDCKLNVCSILYPTDYAIETINNKKFLEMFKFTLSSTHKEIGSLIPYQQGMAIVQGYGDCPNFMLFNPTTEEVILFKEMKD